MLEIQKEPTLITVCICTYRRESLNATLASVTNQVLPDEIKRRILVIDNDVARTAEPSVSQFAASLPGIELKYVHAPGQNISIARNAALKTCDTHWLAFIDDDETAAPTRAGSPSRSSAGGTRR